MKITNLSSLFEQICLGREYPSVLLARYKGDDWMSYHRSVPTMFPQRTLLYKKGTYEFHIWKWCAGHQSTVPLTYSSVNIRVLDGNIHRHTTTDTGFEIRNTYTKDTLFQLFPFSKNLLYTKHDPCMTLHVIQSSYLY